MAPLRIALIGFGKIARDRHVPAIAANSDFTLAAVVSPRSPGPDGVPLRLAADAFMAARRSIVEPFVD